MFTPFKYVVGVLLALSPTVTQAATPDSVSFLQMPGWMQEVMNHSDGVNYPEFVAKFNAFKASLPDHGKKTPYNKPVLNAFRWWQHTYAPYAGKDGIIRLPRQQEEQNMIDRMNRQTELRAAAKTRAGGPDNEPWRVIAPFRTYDFKLKTMVPWQSNVQRLDASNSNPDIVYAGTDTGMMFKTTDRGQSWNACAPMMYFGGEITTVEVSPVNPDKVLVGSVGHLWLTTDGGDHWKNITPASGRTGVRVRDAVFYGNEDNRLIVGTDEGVYLSEDNGKRWTRVLEGRCFDIKVQPRPQHALVYALVNEGWKVGNVQLYTSSDKGVSYDKKVIRTSEMPIASGRLCVNPTAPDYLYALICSSEYNGMPFFQGEPYILKSTDAGRTFTYNKVASQLNVMDTKGGQGYYDMVIASVPHNPEKIFFGNLFIYSSADGGHTVDLHKQHYPEENGQLVPNIGGYFGKYDMHTDMQDIDIAEDGRLWIANDGGIDYSGDYLATQPEVRMNGIYASEFWGFDQGWNEDIIVGGRNHNGNMVQRMDTYDGHSVAMRGSEAATGYVFLSNPHKVTFSDSKQKMVIPDRWDGVFKDFEAAEKFNVWPSENYLYGARIVHDPRYAKCFYVVTESYFGKAGANKRMLWKTTDDGLSYTLLKTFDEDVSGYDVSRTNPDKIIVSLVTHLEYTTDGGKTWKLFPITDDLRDYGHYRVHIHPNDENEIWVSNMWNEGIYRTRDNGQHWEHLGQGLSLNSIGGDTTPYFIADFFLTGNKKNAVYGLGYSEYEYDGHTKRYQGKVLYRDDTMSHWVELNEGLPALVRINRLLPFYKDGKVRIATDNGIRERHLVDRTFTPVPQPIILNVGSGEEKDVTRLQMDSYSIVNQNGATWRWKITPEPVSISDSTARNPVVEIAPQQSYDVTLTITVPVQGKPVTVSKTVHNMIKREKSVASGINASPLAGQQASLVSTLIAKDGVLEVSATGFNAPLDLYVYDTKGNTLLHRPVSDGDQVSVTALPAGIHIYRLEGKNYRKIGKFLIR